MHKIIKIVLFTLAILIVFIAGFNADMYLSERVEVSHISSAYKELAKQCLEKSSFGCCISSVHYMEQNGFVLQSIAGCPEGFQSSMMRCSDSFTWCEPVE
ncbi:MAG: hypothetical protein WCV86_00815 [Patescibacteria group bacterium]|jgi:hypothetical protein